MVQDNLEAQLEALLFVYGEPVKSETLAEKLGVSYQIVRDAISDLKKSLEAENRGLILMDLNEEVQLATKSNLASLVQKVVKEELDSELTAASLETLSIIAYLSPCTRAEIDYIRGVNSSFILRNLTVRGLVEKKLDSSRANGFIYFVSFDFLKHIGLDSTANLPDYEKYKELIKSFMKKENELSQTKS